MALPPRYQRLTEQAIAKAQALREKHGDRYARHHLPHLTVQTLTRKARLVALLTGLLVLIVGLATIIALRTDCSGLSLVTAGLIAMYYGITGIHRTLEELAHRAKTHADEFMDTIHEAVFDQ